MQNIRILIVSHIRLDSGNNTFMILNQLLPILRTKAKVHVTWFVNSPEILNLSSQNDSYKKLDIHDYRNAVDVLRDAKPDIIFDNEYPSLIDLSISFAAKFLNIPVVTRMDKKLTMKMSKSRLIRTYLTKFFAPTYFGDVKKKQRKFMRRGRYFVYKYIFFLKTLKATRMSVLRIAYYFFVVLRINLSLKRPFIDSRFANALHWLPGNYLVEPLLKGGFKRSNFAVTGHPIFDDYMVKFRNVDTVAHHKGKIRVLFLPIQLYELGFWSKKERDFHVREIVKEICNHKNEMSMIVKIHPSSSILYDYESIIHSIDPSIPVYQKGYSHEFLDDADVVVTFPSGSNADAFSLLARKPIVVCNFFNVRRSDILERGLALECKKPSELYNLIQNVLSSNPATKEKVEEYIKDFLYKADGHSSERLCNVIMNLLEKTSLEQHKQ